MNESVKIVYKTKVSDKNGIFNLYLVILNNIDRKIKSFDKRQNESDMQLSTYTNINVSSDNQMARNNEILVNSSYRYMFFIQIVSIFLFHINSILTIKNK